MFPLCNIHDRFWVVIVCCSQEILYWIQFKIYTSEDIQLGDIQLGDIQLGDIQLGDIQLGDIQLGDIQLGDIQLGDIQLGDIQLGDIQLGDIQLGDIIYIMQLILYFFICGLGTPRG